MEFWDRIFAFIPWLVITFVISFHILDAIRDRKAK